MEKNSLKRLLMHIRRNRCKASLWSPYHPQSQGAIEVFNKTVQKSLSAAYDNAKNEKLDWDLEMNLFNFLHYYNFNNEKIREIVMITTEKSRKKHLEK